MRYARRCLTTGVLNRDTATNIAHVEVANFSNTPQRVSITVFNWDVVPVAPIPGCIFIFTIPAHENEVINCILPLTLVHYEVRANIPVGPDVDIVVNTFGVTGPPADPNNRANQNGNTVLFREMVLLNYDECNCF